MDSDTLAFATLLCFFFFFFFFFIVKKKSGRSGNLDDENNSSRDNQKLIFELQNTVSGLKQEKELREKNALEERIAQEEIREKNALKERIAQEEIEYLAEANRLLDNLYKGQLFADPLMEARRFYLSGPIKDAVLQKLYELDKLFCYKSFSSLIGKRIEITYLIEKYVNKEN